METEESITAFEGFNKNSNKNSELPYEKPDGNLGKNKSSAPSSLMGSNTLTYGQLHHQVVP